MTIGKPRRGRPGDRGLWPRGAHPLGAPGGWHGTGFGDHGDLWLGGTAEGPWVSWGMEGVEGAV